MPKKNGVAVGREQDVSEQLDGINARTRQRGPDRLRRKIEASIENKAKKRRQREGSASAGWKK